MIKHYSRQDIDVVLLTVNDMNIGVRALSSFLKEKGFSVLVGFFEAWHENDKVQLETILGWVEEKNPRLVGISSVEFSRSRVTTLVAALRERGRTVVVGGIDATLNPEYYVPLADYVVRGEGEHAMAELAEALIRGGDVRLLPNLWYKDADGAVVRNEMRAPIADIDAIPHEDLLDLRHHYELRDGCIREKRGFGIRMEHDSFRGNALFMVASRGCVFHCSYCSNHKIYPAGTPLRKRSPASITRRIAELRRADPSLNVVCFFDDDFFLRTDGEIEGFSRAWKREVGLPFYVFCSPVTLAEKKLQELVEAGLQVVNMGIQSGSDRTNRDVYNREMDSRHTLEAAALLNKYAGRGKYGLLPPVYDLIINNPYETERDLRETILLFIRLPKPYFVFMYSLALFQGTELHGQAANDGMLSGKDESTQYNFNDTLRHFNYLVRRGGNYYLNSLLYWMSGPHSGSWYGIIPAAAVLFLTKDCVARFFNGNPRLIAFLNAVLPTHKRIHAVRMGMRRRFSGWRGSLFEKIVVKT